MIIDVTDIRKSPGETFHFDLDEVIQPLVVGNDSYVFEKPVKIFLDVKNTGKILIFNGNISGETTLICSRCLESFVQIIDTDFEEQFSHSSDYSRLSEEGINIEDIREFENNRIDFKPIIEDNIVLSIPMKSVCNENCSGLCSKCGVNLNKTECKCEHNDIDPRLAALKDFFKD